MPLFNKQVRITLKEFVTKPGYILDLTRADFTAMFDELGTDIDIMDEVHGKLGNSVAKRFEYFLLTGTDADIDVIVTKLLALKYPPVVDEDEF